MGDFEVLLNYSLSLIVGVIVYNIINSFSFRALMNRFGILKLASKDFYECGFSPSNQEPVKLSIQFMLICIFFLLYDIELVFLFPFVSGIIDVGFFDFVLILFFFSCLFISLAIDYNRHALYWQK